MQEGPIGSEKYEYARVARIRMKIAISEEKDALSRNRYAEKHRISQTIKIICDQNNMDQIYRDLLREPTQEKLYVLGDMEVLYYGAILRYPTRYFWKLEDHLPEKTWMCGACSKGTEWGTMPR